eukprot:SAG11_NODE_832_length_6948_cov_10.083662_5_plen_252_part_00
MFCGAGCSSRKSTFSSLGRQCHSLGAASAVWCLCAPHLDCVSAIVQLHQSLARITCRRGRWKCRLAAMLGLVVLPALDFSVGAVWSVIYYVAHAVVRVLMPIVRVLTCCRSASGCSCRGMPRCRRWLEKAATRDSCPLWDPEPQPDAAEVQRSQEQCCAPLRLWVQRRARTRVAAVLEPEPEGPEPEGHFQELDEDETLENPLHHQRNRSDHHRLTFEVEHRVEEGAGSHGVVSNAVSHHLGRDECFEENV